ncbi:uncharacterized protein LOC123895786 [Trifolium pratense]|uniref:uncharacterized protein LOC123895786 n=1 Tax=Trifolium pratense TaxID=57577 RepID=UPI001E6954D1|nr:uncharacterized protein LOC123895786 [Trifolium pratense]
MAESSNYMQPSVPKFDGYYDHWAMLMENLLRSKEFWSVVENGVTIAPPMASANQQRAADESKLHDLKAKNFLFQSIDRTIMETILDKGSPRDIWEAMRTKYQGSIQVKRAQLQAQRRDFEILAMKDNESINDYFARTLSLVNKMTAQGHKMESTDVVEKILRSLTS